MFEPRLTYQDVVRETEARQGGPCSPLEQCGQMHLVLNWKDGGRRCRCGAVVEKEATDGN
jgi:hypothetical protein